jgi:Protein of unknown function (DUF1236)
MRLPLLAAGTALLLCTTAAMAQNDAPNNNAPNMASPSANSANTSTTSQMPLRDNIRSMLQRSGFSDIQIMPSSFMIRAKDQQGNPVIMSISPDSVTEISELGTSGGNGPSDNSANASTATKYNCVGARRGVVECHTMHMSANSKASSESAASAATTPQHGTDTVILSAAQRRDIWNDLSKQATNQNAAGFEAQTGSFVPSSVKIEPIPSKVAANNPQLRPYDYAMVDHDLMIVDPTNKVIVDVLKK